MAVDILPTRQLGRNGPRVPSLGFGLMGLSSFYGEDQTDEKRFTLLDRAYERGEHFWDTADVYGDNEDLIGKWFARTGKRDEIFLMTKFSCLDESMTGTGQKGFRSEPKYVREACEKSLKRLGTNYIDAYFCQRPDGKTPIEDTVKAMVQLKE